MRRRLDVITALALAWLALIHIAALAAPWLAPYDPLKQNLSDALAPFSSDYWLGADHLGRDVLSRLIYGARVSVIAIGIVTAVAMAIGIPGGLLIGYVGGRLDRYAMRLVDILMSVPGLIIALSLITILGRGLVQSMFAVGIATGVASLRLVRGVTLEVRESLYIDASRAIGTPHRRILAEHVLPNVAGPVAVEATYIASVALLAEAALSFIGLGVPPPQPSWGVMLTDSRAQLATTPMLSVVPGIAITLTVLSINLVGDKLSDRLSGQELRTHPLDRRGRQAPPARTASAPVTDRPAEDAHIVVEGLTVTVDLPEHGTTELVSNLSFTISRGETLALVGESGCGKSITTLAVLGLLPPGVRLAEGSVTIGGEQLTDLSPSRLQQLRRRGVGRVSQDPMTSLNPAHTIGRQLGEVLELEGLPNAEVRRRCIEELERVGIPDAEARMDAYPHELSGGMAQRAAIAAALIHRPEFLVLDEPTTALDVTIQGEILDMLHDLREELGLSMLFVTHDFGVVADIADRALVMYAGQAVEEGDLRSVFSDPRHPYTRALLRSLPEHAHKGQPLPVIEGRVPSAWAWPAGCRFEPRCGEAVEACKEPVGLANLGERRNSRCVHEATHLWVRREAVDSRG
jgi:peptide/nickel transport system permease protein